MARNFVVAKLMGALEKYVDGLEQESINVALLSGRIELSDVSLKKAALEAIHLDIPTHLVVGRVQRLLVEVNWTSLSVNFVINGVDLEVALLSGDTPDPRASLAYISARKEKHARVHQCEWSFLKSARPQPSFSERMLSSLSSHVVTKILRNLKVSITSVQVRLVQYHGGRLVRKPTSASPTAAVEFDGIVGSQECRHFVRTDDQTRSTAAARRNETKLRVDAPLPGSKAIHVSLDAISVNSIDHTDADFSKQVDIQGLHVKVHVDDGTENPHDLLAPTNCLVECTKATHGGSACAAYVVKLKVDDGVRSVASVPDVLYLNSLVRNLGTQKRMAENAHLRDALCRHARWCQHRRPGNNISDEPSKENIRKWWQYTFCVIKRSLRCCDRSESDMRLPACLPACLLLFFCSSASASSAFATHYLFLNHSIQCFCSELPSAAHPKLASLGATRGRNSHKRALCGSVPARPCGGPCW